MGGKRKAFFACSRFPVLKFMQHRTYTCGFRHYCAVATFGFIIFSSPSLEASRQSKYSPFLLLSVPELSPLLLPLLLLLLFGFCSTPPSLLLLLPPCLCLPPSAKENLDKLFRILTSSAAFDQEHPSPLPPDCFNKSIHSFVFQVVQYRNYSDLPSLALEN